MGPKRSEVHDREGPRAHGEDIAQNTADPGSGSLKRLDKRRVIVRLDLESAGPSIADIDDAGIFARALHYEAAASG